jgi:hypothetical protein
MPWPCKQRRQFPHVSAKSTINLPQSCSKRRSGIAIRIAQKYDGRRKRGRGRPRKSEQIEDLVVRMAKENSRWGYRRTEGALSNLGHEVGRGTIAEMLARHGIEPAPERERKRTWKEFLTQHWDRIVAADFFMIEAWTRRGRQRFIVLFRMKLSTRKVEIAGIAPSPKGLWMNQIGRNLTDVVDGILTGQALPHS